MAQLQALLKIVADVVGTDRVQALGKTLGGLGDTAGRVSGGMGALLGRAGALSGALGALAPAVTGVGLAAMAKGAIDAADDMNDLSIATGVSVERLSQFQQAAEMSGTNIEAVGKGLTRLSKAMADGIDSTAEAATKSLEDSIEEQKNAIDQQIDNVKMGADRQVDAIRDAERKQIDQVKQAADRRIEVIQDETERKLDELDDRYDREKQLLDDSIDDQQDALEEQAEDEQRVIERRVSRSYEARRKQIQNDESLTSEQRSNLLDGLRDAQEDEMDVIRDGFQQQAKERQRQFRDLRQAQTSEINARKKAEEDAINDAAENQKRIVENSAKAQEEQIRKTTELSVEGVKQATKAAVKELENSKKQLDPVTESIGKAAEALGRLGISARNELGKVKDPGQVLLELNDIFSKMPAGIDRTNAAIEIFGRKGAQEMLPFLTMSREEIEKLPIIMDTKFAQAADRFNDKTVGIKTSLAILGTQIASVLMPHMEGLVLGVERALTAFAKLPDPIQSIVFGFGVLIATLPVLVPLLWSIATVAGVIAGLKLGATIAGWAYLIRPAIIGIQAAFTGLIAFLTGTIAPALIAFFSSPVGWTILAIAAVVAMAIAFRKPITEFLTWIGGEFMKLAKTFGTWLQPIGQALSSIWSGALKVAGDFFAGVGRLAQNMVRTVRAPFEALGNVIRSVFNGILGAIESGVNGAVNAVNTLIRGYNAIPTAPDLPLIPTLTIPRFAEGGVVDRPTLAMVGDGGEREYIIPESKMAAASARYLSGARGGGVVGPSSINITTGPVLQQDGQQWVSIGDLERAMRQTEASTLARIRTPAGRRALGVR